MSESQTKSNIKTKGNPLTLFIIAIVAYLLGAPIIFPIILAVVGFAVWRARAASQRMSSKLPPLPPRSQEDLVSFESNAQADSDQESRETSDWQQPEMLQEITSDIQKPAPAAFKNINQWAATQSADLTQSQKTQKVSQAPIQTRQKPRKKDVMPALNFSSRNSLRQAVVAMTVLGPCRTLDPYQDSKLGSAAMATNPRRPQPSPEGPEDHRT